MRKRYEMKVSQTGNIKLTTVRAYLSKGAEINRANGSRHKLLTTYAYSCILICKNLCLENLLCRQPDRKRYDSCGPTRALTQSISVYLTLPLTHSLSHSTNTALRSVMKRFGYLLVIVKPRYVDGVTQRR